MSRCRVVIELELEGSEDAAVRVIDRLLDEGVVPVAIHDAASDLGLALVVRSAVSVLVDKRGAR